MTAYFLAISLPAFAALSEASRYFARRATSPLLYLYFLLVLVPFIGLRFEVGSDWDRYLAIHAHVAQVALAEAFARSDPAYVALNLLAGRLGLGIWFVNLACAVIAAVSLAVFAARQNRPWLAAFVLCSYFVIVVVAGLTRQGVAVSLFFLALVWLFEGRRARFVLTVLLAASFHVSALLCLPLVVLARPQGRMVHIAAGLALVGLLVLLGYLGQGETLRRHYLERELASGGAHFRFLFHLMAAAVFLVFARRFAASDIERRVYGALSLAAVLLMAALFVSPSTTLVDRFGFYLFPLQVFAFSNLPNVVLRHNRFAPPALAFVLIVLHVKLLAWFSIGSAPERFLPYRSVLLQPAEVWLAPVRP